MRARRPSPLRGLLAGLLALIAFASSAVAMTAGGSNGDAALPVQAVAAQSAEDAAIGEPDAGRGFDGGRSSDLRDADDGDGRFGGRDGLGR